MAAARALAACGETPGSAVPILEEMSRDPAETGHHIPELALWNHSPKDAILISGVSARLSHKYLTELEQTMTELFPGSSNCEQLVEMLGNLGGKARPFLPDLNRLAKSPDEPKLAKLASIAVRKIEKSASVMGSGPPP